MFTLFRKNLLFHHHHPSRYSSQVRTFLIRFPFSSPHPPSPPPPHLPEPKKNKARVSVWWDFDDCAVRVYNWFSKHVHNGFSKHAYNEFSKHVYNRFSKHVYNRFSKFKPTAHSIRREIVLPEEKEEKKETAADLDKTRVICEQAGFILFLKELGHRTIFIKPTDSVTILEHDFRLMQRQPYRLAICNCIMSISKNMCSFSLILFNKKRLEILLLWDFENDSIKDSVKIDPKKVFECFRNAVEEAVKKLLTDVNSNEVERYEIVSFKIIGLGNFKEMKVSIRTNLIGITLIDTAPFKADPSIENEYLKWECAFSMNQRVLVVGTGDDDLYPIVKRAQEHGFYTMAIGRSKSSGKDLKTNVDNKHIFIEWDGLLK